MIAIGDSIPEFTLMSDKAGEVSAQGLLGKRYILYVYPKDDTFGWTVEATEFRDRIPQYQALGIEVFGLSPDSIESHKQFAEKFQLNFPLLADEDRKLIEALGVWGEREWDGKKFMGVFRTTILVDAQGRVEKVWENVKFQGHAQQILDDLG